MAVAVLADQLQAAVALLGGAGDEVDGGRLFRFQRDAAADRHDRVEHRAFAVGQLRLLAIEHLRFGRAAAAADEPRAVGLVGDRVDVGVVHRQQVEHPRHMLVGRARTARAHDRLQLLHQFGLHEQLAEGGVQRVGDRRRQHHLGVAGQLDRAARAAAVGDARAAQFDVVFRRHHDLGVRVELAFAHAELGARVGEDRLELLGLPLRGLVRGGPAVAAGDVAQVAEHAPVVARDVLVPARQRQLAAPAVAAAGAAQHHVVAAVRQQLHGRARAVGVGEHAQARFGRLQAAVQFGEAGRVQILGRGLRHAFLQQQAGGLELRVGFEAPLHRPAEQRIAQRQQAHALVVRHELPHQRRVLAQR